MPKGSALASTVTFLDWRLAYNALLGLSTETFEKAANPTIDDDSTSNADGPFEVGTIWVNTTSNTAFVLVDNAAGSAIWTQLGATPGAIINDGSVALVANWPVGAYQIQFGHTTGTAPFTVVSTTVVTNLNSDLLDGREGQDYIHRQVFAGPPDALDDINAGYNIGTIWVDTSADPNVSYVCVDNAAAAAVWTELGATPGAIINDGTVPMIADWDIGAYKITGLQFESDVTTGTAPLIVASTTKVTNLNADLFDDQEGSWYQRGIQWDMNVKLASFTAVAWAGYWIDTDTGAGSASNVTVTLPASPTAGDEVVISHVGIGDVATPAANEALQINPGASWRIMGGTLGENLAVDKIGATVHLKYLNSTYGWRIIGLT